jgi:hypothetical protein
MNTSFIQLVVIILAVWRITHLLQAEDGPWDLVFRLRKLMGSSFFGHLMDCFYCLSIWVALPFGYAFGDSMLNRFLLWMALSGGAILLQEITASKKQAP